MRVCGALLSFGASPKWPVDELQVLSLVHWPHMSALEVAACSLQKQPRLVPKKLLETQQWLAKEQHVVLLVGLKQWSACWKVSRLSITPPTIPSTSEWQSQLIHYITAYETYQCDVPVVCRNTQCQHFLQATWLVIVNFEWVCSSTSDKYQTSRRCKMMIHNNEATFWWYIGVD